MIVSCPSCSTRYRHSSPPGLGGSRAHCSRCDETFPLIERNRTYLLREVEAAVPASSSRRMSIGMDDPTLAEKLRETALDAQGGTSPQALTFRVIVPDSQVLEDTPAASADVPKAAAPPIFEPAVASVPEKTPEPLFSPQAPLHEPVLASVAEPLSEAQQQDETLADAGEASETAVPPKAPLQQVLAVAIPLGACTALAYGVSLWQESNPIGTSAIGATAGLLVGWACHQWVRQRSR